jgi:flavin-dependent dehydrogenase
VLDEFITNPHISKMLIDAHTTAPIKGYPLRFDFPQARIAFPGLALIGEACGLVNPLTGEGIDYALESAEVAAEILIQAIRQDESRHQTMHKYSNAFRERFLPTFKSLIQVQKLYSRAWMMNRYVSTAKHNEELALLLVNIGFGNIDPLKALSAKNIMQILLG